MRSVSFATLLLALMVCGCRVGEAPPKTRPASVPASAFWTNMGYGGMYIDCRGPDAQQHYACATWPEDGTGTPSYIPYKSIGFGKKLVPYPGISQDRYGYIMLKSGLTLERLCQNDILGNCTNPTDPK